MELDVFLGRVRAGEPVSFEQTLAVIEAGYIFTPTAFGNGRGADRLWNEPGENNGSCRIFAFAAMHGLSREQTLALFGVHYQQVLSDPAGTTHGNIRRFMAEGWGGIEFQGPVLEPRTEPLP